MSHGALERQMGREFEQLSGASLTLAQAQRLFGLPTQRCEEILSALVSDGVIALVGDRRYAIAPNQDIAHRV